MEKKLYRNEHQKMIGGVCAGLADYFNIDVSIVRVVAVLLMFCKGVVFIPYLILMVVLPKRGFAYNPNFKPGVDYTVPPTDPFTVPFGPGKPFGYPPAAPKKTGNFNAIFGTVLIVLGSLFLIEELNIIPDWDFDKLWPVVLVAVGAAIIVSGAKKQPWEKDGWNKVVTDEPVAEEPKSGIDLNKKNDEPSNDNASTF